MVSNAGLKAVHRFGPRYGRTVKANYAAIEVQQKKLYKCPSCSKEKVKRLANGIWQCQKCCSTFTGRAYTITKKREILEQEPAAAASEEEIEQDEEEAELTG